MVEIKSISMFYGRTRALDGVSFQAEEGKILGLLGPNGAGKTTLMRILTTYLYPTEGTALIGGQDILRNPLSVRKLIGYMPETPPLYDDMLVDEYLIFIGKARGLSSQELTKRLKWVKEACGLRPVWRHAISEISRGFRQRVGLAQALIHDPQVLILDEPATGLDPLQIIGIRDLIRQLVKEKTIIFSTHILQEVEALAERIVILNNGRLVADGTKREITQMATQGERITIVVRARKEDVKNVLSREEAIDKVWFGGIVEGRFVKFLVSGKSNKPLFPVLKKIIEKNGWGIKELRQEEVTLEEAFIWLLSRDREVKDTEP